MILALFHQILDYAGSGGWQRGDSADPGELRTRGASRPRRPVEDLAEALRNGDARSISAGCFFLAEWAESKQKRSTARAFIEAGLRIHPRDAQLNWFAGQIALRSHEPAAAEQWFTQAVELGKATETWGLVARGYLGLGNLQRDRPTDQTPEDYLSALRYARKAGAVSVEAEALHNLCVVWFNRNDAETALSFAYTALFAYGHHVARVAELANDLAWFWMHTKGEFARALSVLLALPPHISEPVPKLSLLASIARAAGGAGHREYFRWAAEGVWRKLAEVPDRQWHAKALLDVANGAATLHLTDQARKAATRVQEIAAELGLDPEFDAKAAVILASLRASRRGATQTTDEDPRPLEPTDQAEAELAKKLVGILNVAKLDGRLARMYQAKLLVSEEALWLVVECDASDLSRVRAAIQGRGGEITDKIRGTDRTSIYTHLRRDRILDLTEEPTVWHIGLVERYRQD
ncbi:MAG TPA: hypothetical protein VGR37_02605 [Longimicrobiaceae bacterium]|nr:hypothetical protein [Longimicrobiaceae bacterium]